jgi:hypothetical protein
LWDDDDDGANWLDFVHHLLERWPRPPLAHRDAFTRWLEACDFPIHATTRRQTATGWGDVEHTFSLRELWSRFTSVSSSGMGPGRFVVPALPTTGELAAFLHLGVGDLLWLADPRHLLRHHPGGPLQHYFARWVPKRSGGARLLEAPKARLRSVQRRVLAEVLGAVPAHPAAHGFVPGRSALSHAGLHVGRAVVVRLDLREFFPSVGRRRVAETFRALGYPDRVADTLTGLCTTCTPRQVANAAPDRWSAQRYAAAHLPQGAPSSPKLANLAAYGLDVRLSAFAEANGVTYSRYADDLAFSGDSVAQWFPERVAEIVVDEGFRVNPAKTRRTGRGTRQALVGVVVNAGLGVPRAERERLEAILPRTARAGRSGGATWRGGWPGCARCPRGTRSGWSTCSPGSTGPADHLATGVTSRAAVGHGPDARGETMWGWLIGCVQVQLVPAPWPEVDPAPDPTLTTDPDCAPSEDAAITSFTAVQGRMVNQAEVTVETAGNVPVAVRCTLDADPTEVHLLEDQGGTTHGFRFEGLLPSETYTCEAAATCPRSPTLPDPVTIVTGAPPGGLASLDVEVSPQLGMTGAYTLFNLDQGGGCSGGGWLQVVDREGRPRFWHPLQGVNVDTEARLGGDGTIAFGGGFSPDGRVRLLDLWDGIVYDSATSLRDADETIFHHDGKVLADGRILTLELETTRSGDLSFEGFRVRLHDPATEAVVWTYSSQQAVDRGELPVYSGGDEWHANWVDVVVEGGPGQGRRDVLYVSLCFYGWVLKIDPVAGVVEWVLGAGGDFSLVDHGGRPLGEDQFSQCQHGLEVQGDHVLFYDNGWYRGQSRASEYEVDADTGIARLLWTWEDDWYETTLGDADYLPNGRVLVTKAHPSCWSYGSGSEIVEIDPLTGLAASRLSFAQPDAALYRAERIDGCDLFANAATCPAIADRVLALEPAFTASSAGSTP